MACFGVLVLLQNCTRHSAHLPGTIKTDRKIILHHADTDGTDTSSIDRDENRASYADGA